MGLVVDIILRGRQGYAYSIQVNNMTAMGGRLFELLRPRHCGS